MSIPYTACECDREDCHRLAGPKRLYGDHNLNADCVARMERLAALKAISALRKSWKAKAKT